MNNNGLQDRGILDVIRLLSAQGASGRLQVSTGMTEGALFFARGRLVDARLGRLNGFQAINALVSVPDASYNFDPAIAPPAQSSIAANERLLLKDFFGIEVANNEHSNDVAPGWLEDDARPEQVAPLANVAPKHADEQQLRANEDDEATLVRPEAVAAERPPEPFVGERGPVVTQPGPVVAEPVAERVAEPPPAPVFAAPRHEPILAEPRPPLASRPVARSRFVPVLVLILLTVLMAAAAVALRNRFRNPDSTASIAPSAQTSPDVAQQPATQTAPQPATQTARQPATHTSGQPETQKTAQSATTAQPATQETRQTAPQTAAAVPDLNGNWKVINTVEQTAYEPYRNMEIGFNVAINQAGKDFTGTGEKISENGRSLPAAGRTAILVKGRIEGDRINATFLENGAARKTNGRFVWRIDRQSGGLTGTFISTAARTSGRSAAKKVL